MQPVRPLVVLAILPVVPAFSAAGGITDHLLYEQQSPTAHGEGANVYYSNPTHNQVMYDDFRIDTTTEIEGIGFWGAVYVDSAFTVSIYEHDALSGLPGALAFRQVFDAASLNLELSGTVVNAEFADDEHHALAAFDSPFVAQGDRRYWLAIEGDSFFSWTYGAESGDDTILYSDSAQTSFWTQGDLGRDPTNLAFSIYGTPVPAPAGLGVLVGSLAAATRRRRLG